MFGLHLQILAAHGPFETDDDESKYVQFSLKDEPHPIVTGTF